MDTQASHAPEGELPTPDGRLIDFDRTVVITPMIYPPRPRLVVSGEMPPSVTEVALVPLVYVSQPPYWGIQVVGSVGDDVGLHPMPVAAPATYSVELDLAGITGTCGVEVIGASRTEQIELPAEAPAEPA
jgi:hypothetical protein